jgi:hypothetical protein
MKPRMFIASSSENLDLAYAAQEGLEHDVESAVWTQGVFAPSKTTMTSLLKVLGSSDFGLFVLAPSDVTEMRKTTKQTVRDNVVFELGLFIGRFGPERCFLAVPRDVGDLHLPTDLLGLTPVTFDPNRQDGNLVAALGPACSRIRKSIAELGARLPAQSSEQSNPDPAQSLTSDPDDCIALLQSWMGARSTSENNRAMRYDDIDRELRLAPGSARAYIEQAAKRYSYRAERKGKDFILFVEDHRETSSWISARGGWQAS